ncbi:hypothetical protein J5X98_03805 [Leptothermofonsia sichuanensis E412]|uniref:hypothetical protein n=1 Tax=Leptothermofonsia sichuanensis TaxID=2917832 RepID=UPI001CA78144|nr:hypothetical protein [Leptothermofonsia sichuanensis]QZZ21595.1 hypothetical protein J5X98_03805 [Leptothermofonsia sichuanensis E412]
MTNQVLSFLMGPDLDGYCHNSTVGIAEKQDELKRRFKHPALFSSPDLATPNGLFKCLVLDDSVA